jgi:hypothetical protein
VFQYVRFDRGHEAWLEIAVEQHSDPEISTMSAIVRVEWDDEKKKVFYYQVDYLFRQESQTGVLLYQIAIKSRS